MPPYLGAAEVAAAISGRSSLYGPYSIGMNLLFLSLSPPSRVMYISCFCALSTAVLPLGPFSSAGNPPSSLRSQSLSNLSRNCACALRPLSAANAGKFHRCSSRLISAHARVSRHPFATSRPRAPVHRTPRSSTPFPDAERCTYITPGPLRSDPGRCTRETLSVLFYTGQQRNLFEI